MNQVLPDGFMLLVVLLWTLGLVQFLQQGKRQLSEALSPQEVWRTGIAITVYVLALGWFASSGSLLYSFYYARYWCMLIAALLALIFWMGSTFHIRLVFFTGAIVLLGLETYSAGRFKNMDEILDAAIRPSPVLELTLGGYAIFCCALLYFVLARRLKTGVRDSVKIFRLLVKEDPQFDALPLREKIWGALGKFFLTLLVAGTSLVTIVTSDLNFMITLYHERVWCLLIAACLVVIFWGGSFPQKRLAGIIGVLVFGGLEVYSVLVENPSFHWILVGYAAFCLGLSLRVLAERFHPHHPDAVHTA